MCGVLAFSIVLRVKKNPSSDGSTARMTSLPEICFPGQPLGESYAAGHGTYLKQGNIISAIVGRPSLNGDTLTVDRLNKTATETNVLANVNDIVLARITRINPRQANAVILVVGEAPVKDEYQGVIRVQDIRMFEKDKVKVYTSFRPGDIVRAQVISLGDQNNYYLSTADNELGVVFATSENGETMVPLSWREMRWSQGVEERKVAKPI